MLSLIIKKKKSLTLTTFIMGLLFINPLDFLNVFLIIFVFGITNVAFNYLKNIYYIEGMKTIIH